MPIRNGKFTDWKSAVEIKDLLNKGDAEITPETFLATAQEIERRFRANGWPEHRDDELDEVLFWLKDSSTEGETEFNYRLDELYDWADGRLVWLGI